MKNAIIVQGFDYSTLDKDTADKLKCLAQSGHRAVRQSMIKFIHDFGKELTEARKLLAKHGEGTFCRWATQEFDISRQTVYNYLNGYGRGLSNGLTNCESLTPTALYLATAESTPEDIMPKVKKLAAKQQVVTRSDVQAIIDRAYPPDTPDEDIIDETPSTPILGNSAEPVPDCDPSPLDTPEPPVMTEADIVNAEVEAECEEETAEEEMKRVNSEIESFCRSLAAWYDENAPSDIWLTDAHLNALESARSKIRAAQQTLRTGKCSKLCPLCNGDGCKQCLDTGRVPNSVYQQMV